MKTKNILVLTYWSYKEALVQTCVLPYLTMIRKATNYHCKIYLYTFENPQFKMTREEWEQEVRKWNLENVYLYRSPYFRFSMLNNFRLLFIIIRLVFFVYLKKIRFVHCFGTSAAVIGVPIKFLTFTKLTVDSYEPHAECMVENGEWLKESVAFRLFYFLEKYMTKYSNHAIATAKSVKYWAKNRFNYNIPSFFVKPAGVNTQKFNPQNFHKNEIRSQLNIPLDAIVCVYIGKFGGIYYKEEIFQFIKAAQDYWKDQFYFVVGTPLQKQEFEELANQYHINLNQVLFQSYIPHEKVPEFLAIADFGLNPVKPLPTKRYCTSVKDGEYWAMELPVVIPPNISDDSDYIKEKGIGVIWDDTSYEGCLKACQEMDKLLHSENLPEIKKTIRQLAIEVRDFKNFEKIYQAIYGG